jgi:hypothetical protein
MIIARALAQRHDERARPDLVELQKHPEYRLKAEEALRLLGGPAPNTSEPAKPSPAAPKQ